MKVYRTDEIRNVVLLGHGGSGKTSLAEAVWVKSNNNILVTPGYFVFVGLFVSSVSAGD